jgi:hypothetical protein
VWASRHQTYVNLFGCISNLHEVSLGFGVEISDPQSGGSQHVHHPALPTSPFLADFNTAAPVVSNYLFSDWNFSQQPILVPVNGAATNDIPTPTHALWSQNNWHDWSHPMDGTIQGHDFQLAGYNQSPMIYDRGTSLASTLGDENYMPNRFVNYDHNNSSSSMAQPGFSMDPSNTIPAAISVPQAVNMAPNRWPNLGLSGQAVTGLSYPAMNSSSTVLPQSQHLILTTSTATPPAPATVARAARISCTQPNCIKHFKRNHERVRHERSVHGIGQILYRCPILGCPRSQGGSYSRADKLTEHMWMKHADLGYTKRV